MGKKYNELVNRKPIGNAIRKELWFAIDQLHRETKIPKATLWDEAAELLLRKYGKEIPEETAGHGGERR
ncbi:ribbon-helix-helix domain-containing protein [Staphylospora marina]|uniref:ribbon-helix-helix domain-containing protein n=1 Tax=Staphylospora marina TaxID=2490858 RepID=UPI000F5BB90A|nr:ribbon-helix-helix domain-containing protein [Staphylospora marina]